MVWSDLHTIVLRYAAMDDTAEMTGERIGLSTSVVKARRHQASKMLGVHTLPAAIAEAIRRGYLSLDDADHPGYIDKITY